MTDKELKAKVDNFADEWIAKNAIAVNAAIGESSREAKRAERRLRREMRLSLMASMEVPPWVRVLQVVSWLLPAPWGTVLSLIASAIASRFNRTMYAAKWSSTSDIGE